MSSKAISAVPQATPAMEALVHDITHAIEAEGSVKTVFGEAVKLDGHTIIPVASVTVSGGGGGAMAGSGAVGRAIQGVAELAKRITPGSFGGGMGGAVDLRIRPIGFIHEGEHGLTFTGIPHAS